MPIEKYCEVCDCKMLLPPSVARQKRWCSIECRDVGRAAEREPYYTMDELKACANQCATRTEMSKRFSPQYLWAARRKLLDHLFAKHNTDGFATVRWTREKVIDEGKKYETRRQFALGSATAYYAALREGWDVDVCAHMRIVGNQSWRAVYAIKASERHAVYIGLSHDPEERYRQHISRGKKAVRNLLTANHTFEILTKLLPAAEATQQETRLIAEHRSSGWTVLNERDRGTLGGHTQRWTREQLAAIAHSCSTRGEMMERYSGAYQTARNRGILDQLFANHSGQGLARRKLSRDLCIRVARTCANRKELMDKDANVYNAGRKNGWLQEMFAHAENAGKQRRPIVTFEECKAIVAGVATRQEFCERYPAEWTAAHRNKWMNRLFEHHVHRGYTRIPRVAASGLP
jgi:predicted GIY-YIG superfamily endonuclease